MLRRFCLILVFIMVVLMLPVTSALAYNMPYYIYVDLSNNIVTVYSAEDDSIVRQMICSGGKASTPSPTGTYYMTEKYKTMERTEWYVFEDGYGQYGSRIWGNYLFHSYLFNAKDLETVKQDSYAGLGTAASHGCIRLFIEDAKWVAENCMPGTRVKLYYTDERFDYIKEIIYTGTYSVDSGISYNSYVSMAENEGELGFGSEGEEVTALQQRLIELGMYGAEADEYYGPLMVRTVKSVQKLLGMEVTGVADAAFIEAVNSEDCPISFIGTVSEGMSGEGVVGLQKVLTALGLYEGEISGVYDEATVEAVMSYQLLFGYEQDGIVTPEMQMEMLNDVYGLSTAFGEYGAMLAYDEKIVTAATVVVDLRLNVRDVDGNIIGSVDNGETVEVIKVGEDRTHIRYRNGKEGYVSTDYLQIYEDVVLIPKYVAAEDAESALPELDMEGYAGFETRAYGKINVNSRVNFRDAPDAEAELVYILSPYTTCEIISVSDDGWVYARYGDRYGYAIAKYFDIEYVNELTGEYVEFGN